MGCRYRWYFVFYSISGRGTKEWTVLRLNTSGEYFMIRVGTCQPRLSRVMLTRRSVISCVLPITTCASMRTRKASYRSQRGLRRPRELTAARKLSGLLQGVYIETLVYLTGIPTAEWCWFDARADADRGSNFAVLQNTLRVYGCLGVFFAREPCASSVRGLWLTRARRSSPSLSARTSTLPSTNLVRGADLHDASLLSLSLIINAVQMPLVARTILGLTGSGSTHPRAWRAACNCEALAHPLVQQDPSSIDEFIVAQMHNQHSLLGKPASQTRSYISYLYTPEKYLSPCQHPSRDNLLSLSIFCHPLEPAQPA
jgi:hypothetical protein